MQQEILTEQITACLAEITRLDGERERCIASLVGAFHYSPALDDLRRLLEYENALAFIERRTPNVGELEKEIAALEKVLGVEQASAAHGAINHINELCRVLRIELAALRAKLTTNEIAP